MIEREWFNDEVSCLYLTEDYIDKVDGVIVLKINKYAKYDTILQAYNVNPSRTHMLSFVSECCFHIDNSINMGESDKVISLVLKHIKNRVGDFKLLHQVDVSTSNIITVLKFEEINNYLFITLIMKK